MPGISLPSGSVSFSMNFDMSSSWLSSGIAVSCPEMNEAAPKNRSIRDRMSAVLNHLRLHYKTATMLPQERFQVLPDKDPSRSDGGDLLRPACRRSCEAGRAL